MQMVCKQLEQCLTEHTPYKTKDLKLSDLARAINITAHELSSLLNNQHLRTNQAFHPVVPFTKLLKN